MIGLVIVHTAGGRSDAAYPGQSVPVAVVSPVRLHRESLQEVCRDWPRAGAVSTYERCDEDRPGPRLLLVDLACPDLLAWLPTRAESSRTGRPVIVWGGYPRVERVVELRTHGARAYVSVLTHVGQLHAVLDAVLAGHEVFPDLQRRVDAVPLGARELQVAWCYAVEMADRPRADVARVLGISENTLKVHLGRVRSKLAGEPASTRTQLRRTLLALYPDQGAVAESGPDPSAAGSAGVVLDGAAAGTPRVREGAGRSRRS